MEANAILDPGAKSNTAARWIPGPDVIARVMEVYERGQTLEALRRAESFAPLTQWRGSTGCVLAARLAANSGAPRLSTRLTVRAKRADETDAEALSQYGYEILGRRGALALWQFLNGSEANAGASTQMQAELLALKARAASDLRDFATAETLLDRAESIDPNRAWIRLQRSHLLEAQDRVEEALEVALSAGALHPHPHYRPAVQIAAHLLQLLDRDEESIDLLRSAAAVLQNAPVLGQLYSLLSENGRWTEARQALDGYVSLSPLIEKPLRQWVESQKARAAYHLGERDEAARCALGLDDDFHKQFAGKLATPPPPVERVQLDVTFVRQHFKTCAPATLAALARFWQMPAEHLKLAESMCYDGTPSWQQRDWAEKHGWHVCEFRVTEESAMALIEKGVPFALSAVEATSAHMMAVIGFDRTRGTLLLRDPSQPYVIEWHAVEFFKRQRPFGPHGMVFVPLQEVARLEGLDLPEAGQYDRFHQFCLAISGHDRVQATAVLEKMETDATEAPVTWEARLGLAHYDANTSEEARCLDKLLALFPQAAARLLRRFDCLRNAPREEQIRFLKTACTSNGADPALFIVLARALQGDARFNSESRRWLKRGMRRRPLDSSAISALADLLWLEGCFEEATELYRFAANLEGFREQLYQSWFVACRKTRRTTEALAHLEDRFARFGPRSDQPALTLAWAWCEMEQPARARQVLEEAMRLRPDDGYVRLRAASVMARNGDWPAAEKYLLSARDKVRESDWLRSRAEIAENHLDFDTVVSVARALLEKEPFALDARGALTRALARREGTAVALAELKTVCSRFPHHLGLQRMVVEWSAEAGPEAREAASAALLLLDPSDAWARRERALSLLGLKRGEAALQAAAEAARIEPRNSYNFSVLGFIHRQLGQVAEARAQYQKAVTLSVDNSEAVNSLLELARTDGERKDVLSFVERELISQVVTGDGLIAFAEIARPILEPESLVHILGQAHLERPDLWHAWVALGSQLGHLGRLDESLALATEACQRFPHLPRVWLELASVHNWRNQPEEEITAAQRAFEMNPAWGKATFTLTSALERRGRLDEAGQIYLRALTHAPQDAQLYAFHATLLWRQRKSAQAFDAIRQALRLSPGYEWAWELLMEWSIQSGHPEGTRDFARTLAAEYPGNSRVWLMLARVLVDPNLRAERLSAVDRAIELDQRLVEAWDLKADLLCVAEQFEEAIRACADGIAICTHDTHILEGRRAWIEAQRRQWPEAVVRMRAVLAENKSYVWGWHQLAMWLLEQGALVDATSALERLQKLRPHDAWVNRQLGFLRLKQQDKTGAIKAFSAALGAVPTDVAAGHNLLELQLESSDVAGATTTLQIMQTHQPGAATLTAEILLRLREWKTADAEKAFKTLCSMPDPDGWPVETAVNAFQRTNQSQTAFKILKKALKSVPCNPQVAAAAIRLLAAKGALFSATWLFLRLKPGELQRRAASVLIQALATKRQKNLIRWVVWRRRAMLMSDDNAWGQVGFAWATLSRMKAVAAWLSDWRGRPSVQPWMLFNYCLALRYLGRYPEATEVASHVLQKWGHRQGAGDMRLFLAVEKALAGELDEAREHLNRVQPRPDTAHDRQLLALAKGILDFQSSPAADRRKKFATFRREMAPHFGDFQLTRAMRDVRRTFQRAGELLQREGAGPGAWLWFEWKLHWQWLSLPALALVLILLIPQGIPFLTAHFVPLSLFVIMILRTVVRKMKR